MQPFSRAGKFRRILAYARPESRALAFILALTFVSSALAALQPWPLKVLIDFGLSGAALPVWAERAFASAGVSTAALTIIAAAALAGALILMLNAALDAVVTLMWSRAGQRMVYRLATALFF